jgi:hypothetical protein
MAPCGFSAASLVLDIQSWVGMPYPVLELLTILLGRIAIVTAVDHIERQVLCVLLVGFGEVVRRTTHRQHTGKQVGMEQPER